MSCAVKVSKIRLDEKGWNKYFTHGWTPPSTRDRSSINRLMRLCRMEQTNTRTVFARNSKYHSPIVDDFHTAYSCVHNKLSFDITQRGHLAGKCRHGADHKFLFFKAADFRFFGLDNFTRSIEPILGPTYVIVWTFSWWLTLLIVTLLTLSVTVVRWISQKRFLRHVPVS